MGAITSGITHAVRKHCYERDGHRCQNPKCPNKGKQSAFRWHPKLQRWVQKYLHLHHCFFRSRYKQPDVNDPWNLCTLCNTCHDLIHHPPMDKVAEGNELEQWCIALAESRRGETVAGLDIQKERARSSEHKERERQRRKEHYQNAMQRFKDRNNGLSPSQVSYRKLKAMRKS